MEPQGIASVVLLSMLISHSQNTSGAPLLPCLEALGPRLFQSPVKSGSVKADFENHFKRGLCSTEVNKVVRSSFTTKYSA